MSPKDIINDKNDRLETVPDAYVAAIVAANAKHYKEVIGLLRQLKITGGKIDPSAENLKIILSFDNQLKAIVLDKNFKQNLITFAKEFNIQAGLNNSYFSSVVDDFVTTDIYKDILSSSKKDAIKLLLNGVDSEFVAPISNALKQGVINNSGFSETLANIERIISGDAHVEGKLARYSKLYARETFAVSDRAYSQAVSSRLGMEWFWYSGGRVSDSRAFCIERNDRYFHKKEIELWGSGVNTGFTEPQSGEWSGRKDGTNSSTIFSYLGGWNCMHSVMGTTVYVVPKSDVKRAIDKGYYKP